MELDIARDRWGRPLITPPGGGDPIAYIRVSTLAKALDDLNSLMAWKQRKTAEGLLRRQDLLTRIAGIVANGDPDTDWPTKKALNQVCREATEAAASSKGASAGTGFHALTDAIDRGAEPQFIPEQDRTRLDAYKAATADLEVLAIEQFIVNDEVLAAGTFDRLVRLPDGRVVVADLKTGKSEAAFPLATTIQIATYAHGELYDGTGARTPLHADLDTTTGLLIHLPPSGGCSLYRLDLALGWEAAQLAARVSALRKVKADRIAQEVA